jgi:hypothetical protein
MKTEIVNAGITKTTYSDLYIKILITGGVSDDGISMVF